MSIAHITSSAGFHSALQASSLVVVDFYATWCGPCKALTPKYEAMARAHPTVRFCKVDVDALDAIAAEHNVTGMPTIVLYKRGREVARIVGADAAKIEAAVLKHK
jgi:thioredoxin